MANDFGCVRILDFDLLIFFSPIMVQLHAIFCRTITLHFFPFQMRLKFVLTAILEEQEF